MLPLAIAAIAAFALVLSSHTGTDPFKAGTVAPTPGGQQNPMGVQPGTITQPEPNIPSPNSVETTINGTIAVANQAMGMFDSIQQLFPTDSDSEYVG